MIVPAGATGHEAIAKIDQAAQGDEREKNRLFQPDGMGNAGLFFENGPGPDVGTGAGFGASRKTAFSKYPLQFHTGADITILDRNRCLVSQLGALANQRLCAKNFAACMNGNAFGGNSIWVNVVTNLHTLRVGDLHAFFN